MKLPFVILTRSRWERIRMALDAWPRMVDHLGSQLSEALAAKLTDRAPCPGCGSTKPADHYTERGYISCCPDGPR